MACCSKDDRLVIGKYTALPGIVNSLDVVPLSLTAG